MIYFITNRPHHFDNDPRVKITDDFSLVTNYLTSVDSFAIDKEFNGLNAINAIPLLTQVGGIQDQFVVDNIAYPSDSWLTPFREKEMLGHNIKIDLSVATRNGFDLQPHLMRIWDTMVFEQRVGMDSRRGNDLASVYARRCGKALSKAGRENFINMKGNSTFLLEDIIYAAYDVEVLPEIKKVQERYLDMWKLELLLKGIEFPLIPILAKAELEGFTINEEQWLKNIQDNKKELFEQELILDEELRKVGFSSPIRRKEEVVQINIFGEETGKTNKMVKNINYSSPKQIAEAFKKVGQSIPRANKKKVDTKTGAKKYEDSDTLAEGDIQTFIIENPRNIMIPFLEQYMKYKKIEKQLSSFGDKFIKSYITTKGGTRQIGYKNEKTGKVHTIYRQCFTKTGRLSSGEAAIGYYNSQQVPAVPKYRTAFTLTQEEIDNDWWITTSDLSGAEVIIMCAFARDKKLYKWAVEEDDLHSPMATLCWRAIYKHRKTIIDNSWATGECTQVDKGAFKIKDSKNNVHILTGDMTIVKDDSHPLYQLRTDFKSVTFGVIYGAEANTIAKVLNISKKEAQIVIDTIRDTIPDTFEMVIGAAEEALNEQNVLLNTRTNSRKHFIETFKGRKFMDSKEIQAVSSEARNVKIQGTQADMIKEAMVEIYRFFEFKGVKHCPLLQVHDELVWKHQGKENGQWIPLIMGEVATRYLEGFTSMKSDAKILHTWTK